MILTPHPVDREVVEATLDRPVYRRPEGDIRVRDVIATLQEAGIRAWVVGGAPRDWLCGQVSQDVDLSLDRDLASAHEVTSTAGSTATCRGWGGGWSTGSPST